METINAPFRLGALAARVPGFYPDQPPVLETDGDGGYNPPVPAAIVTFGDAAPRYDCTDPGRLDAAMRTCLRVSQFTLDARF